MNFGILVGEYRISQKAPYFPAFNLEKKIKKCLKTTKKKEVCFISAGERFSPGIGQVNAADEIKREIIHQLSIRPMAHSELVKALPEDVSHGCGGGTSFHFVRLIAEKLSYASWCHLMWNESSMIMLRARLAWVQVNSSDGKGRKEAKKEQHMKEAGIWEPLQLLSLFNTVSNQAIWPAVSAGCLHTLN